jgi:hypothetical protein
MTLTRLHTITSYAGSMDGNANKAKVELKKTALRERFKVQTLWICNSYVNIEKGTHRHIHVRVVKRDEFQQTTHSKHLYKESWDSVIWQSDQAAGWKTEESWLDSRQKQNNFFFSPKCPNWLQVFCTRGTGGSFPDDTWATARTWLLACINCRG